MQNGEKGVSVRDGKEGEKDMEKRFKHGLLFMLLFCSVFFTVPALKSEAYTYSVSEITAKLGTLRNQYVGTVWNGEYYGKQCKGFANLIFYKLFDVVHIGPYTEPEQYYIANPSGAYEVGRIGFSGMSLSASKELLQKGAPGDFIQARRRNKTYGHSMILVSQDAGGIWIFDCNASDTPNLVRYYYQTWSEFYNKNSAMSLYRASNYTVTSDPWSFTGNHMPSSIGVGAQFPLSGVLTANTNILDVCIQVFDSDYNKVSEIYKTPYCHSYDISGDSGGFFTPDQPGRYHIFATALIYGISERVSLFDFYCIVLADDPTIADGIYAICPTVDDTQALDIEGRSAQSGARIVTGDRDGSDYQKFYFYHVGQGYYKIINCATGNALDVRDAGVKNGTAVQQCTSTGNAAQKWQVLPVADYYCLVPQNADHMCLNLAYWPNDLTAGTNLDIWTPNVGDAQKFSLREESFDHRKGSRIFFENASFGDAVNRFSFTGMNTGRGSAATIVYNVGGTPVVTNTWGAEAAVDANGCITAVRRLQEAERLTVPEGGFVISSHISAGSCSAINSLTVGQYAFYDMETKTVAVYAADDHEAFLAASKLAEADTAYGCLPVPKKEGFIFEGWYTEENGGERVTYYSQCRKTDLYAHWKEKKDTAASESMIYEGHFYELYDYSMSWDDARAFCEERGGYLTAIASQEENAAVTELAARGEAGWYWIGCSDAETEGVWKWSNGELFSYANWDLHGPEPSGGNPENYAQLISIDNPPNKHSGEWNDAPLSPQNRYYYGICNGGFICEYDTKQIAGCLITLSSEEYTYDGKEKKPAVTVWDGSRRLALNTDYLVTYSGNLDAGTAKAKITGIGIYTGSVSRTFVIAKAKPVLSFKAAKVIKTYGDNDFANELTAVTDGEVVYSSTKEEIASVDQNGTVTIHRSGRTMIQARSLSGENYLSGGTDYILDVEKKQIDMSGIRFDSRTVLYDGNAHSIEIAGALPEGIRSVSYENNEQTEAGSYTVTVHFYVDASRYASVEDYTAVLTIVPASAGLRFKEAVVDKTYGDPSFYNELLDSSGRTSEYSSSDPSVAEINAVTGEITVRNAGTAIITARLPETGNYVEGLASFILNVRKAVYDMSNVIFRDKTTEYDGTKQAVFAEGLPEGVTAKYTGNDETDAGSYVVTAHFTGDEKNYEAIPDRTAVLTITKKAVPLEFSYSYLTKAYGEAAFTNPLKADSEGAEVVYASGNTDVAAVDQTGRVTINGVGTTIITVGIDENGNYQKAFASYELDVKKGEYDMSGITLEDQTVIYDGESHSLKIEGILPKGVTVRYSGNDRIDPGEYFVTAYFIGDEYHYNAIPSKTAVMTIRKLASGIAFEKNEITKYAGDADFENPLYLESDGMLRYSSSDPSVAVVDRRGMITVVGAGTTIIRAFCSATNYYEKCEAQFTLFVKEKKGNNAGQGGKPDNQTEKNLDSNGNQDCIVITAISSKIAAGKKVQLKIASGPEGAAVPKLIWSSGNPKVAAVTADGIVTLKKKSGGRTVTITARTADGKMASFTIKSMKGIVKKVSIKGKNKVKAGKSIKLRAKVTATRGAYKKIRWKSGNKKYAAVSADGRVHAYKAGKGKTVKIMAYAVDGSGKKAVKRIKIR